MNWSCSSEVECLPNKCKALGLIPSNEGKKKKSTDRTQNFCKEAELINGLMSHHNKRKAEGEVMGSSSPF
jgi:hypothetical protein